MCSMELTLVRQPDESFLELLNWLDRALGDVNATDTTIDDIKH